MRMRSTGFCLSLAAGLALAAHSASAADNRFDAVSIYGGVSSIDIEASDSSFPDIDTDGSAVGVGIRKSLRGPLFFEARYQFSDLDSFRSGNFFVDQELTRYAVGFGAHSDEDARWIGFWRMDYTGIEFAVTAPDGSSDNEDGFALNAGVILAATRWMDLSFTGGFLGLDELNGADFETSVEFNVVPEVTLGGTLRYTIVEDDDGNQLEIVTPLLRVSYRFGGRPLFGGR